MSCGRNDVTLRPLRPDDLPALARLFRDTIHRVNARDYSPRQRAAWAPEEIPRERWRKSFEGKFCVVAVEGDQPVGFADLRDDGYLDRFFARHDRQRSGIGRRMLAAIEEEARRRGLGRLFVEVSITARPFFEAQGYRVEHEQEVEVRGERLRNFAMTRDLT